jgi:hypothetical protein
MEGGLIMCPLSPNKTTKPSVTTVGREGAGVEGTADLPNRSALSIDRSNLVHPFVRKEDGKTPRSRRGRVRRFQGVAEPSVRPPGREAVSFAVLAGPGSDGGPAASGRRDARERRKECCGGRPKEDDGTDRKREHEEDAIFQRPQESARRG